MLGRIVKSTDITRGHGGPPTHILNYSVVNVFVDGANPIVIGDTYAPHKGVLNPRSGPTTHPVSVIQGSQTVFINGIPVLREGDQLSCGDIAAVQIGTVFCG